LFQKCYQLITQVVCAYTTYHSGVHAKVVDLIGHIHGGATGHFAARQQVPQHFAKTNNQRLVHTDKRNLNFWGQTYPICLPFQLLINKKPGTTIRLLPGKKTI
jgi:hypothetical protein